MSANCLLNYIAAASGELLGKGVSGHPGAMASFRSLEYCIELLMHFFKFYSTRFENVEYAEGHGATWMDLLNASSLGQF